MKKFALFISALLLSTICLVGCAGSNPAPAVEEPTTKQPTTQKPTEPTKKPAIADIDNPVCNVVLKDADRTTMSYCLCVAKGLSPKEASASITKVWPSLNYEKGDYLIGKCSGDYCSYQESNGNHCCVLYPFKMTGTLYYKDSYGNDVSLDTKCEAYLRSCDGFIFYDTEVLLDKSFKAGNGNYYVLKNAEGQTVK